MSMMEQVTPNVFTNTKLRGCNPSFVVTAAGVVVIDTPQLPTKAVGMRQEAESHGPIRYVINTENHVDHIFGNHWFRGAGEVVNHKALWDIFMDPRRRSTHSITRSRRSRPTIRRAPRSSPIATRTTPTCRAERWCSPAT
jgi:glyoxylase-like metal-dependent hydrolase (beta-lactamase superfamily II)